jgi:hypothetical protein
MGKRIPSTSLREAPRRKVSEDVDAIFSSFSHGSIRAVGHCPPSHMVRAEEAKKPKKKADNYKICKAKGKAGPSWASSYYSKMKMKTKCGVDITR